jgi:hypothetical protein
MFSHFLNVYTSHKFVSVVTKRLLQHLVCFCSGFPKFKTELYTDTLLTQVSHHQTANSQKHNVENTLPNNKPNHSTLCATLIQEGCGADTYHCFDVLITIQAQNSNFGNFWIVSHILKQAHKVLYNFRSVASFRTAAGACTAERVTHLFVRLD